MSESSVILDAEGQWMTDFFRDADKLDLPLLMSWFAQDIDLRIANMPPVIGWSAVEKSFADFWANLSGMSHRAEELVVKGDNGAQMSIVTYTRKDGKTVSMPVASHIRRNASGKFDRLWIYIDINPLFAE
ncbi:MAG: nuclear transport factor 2 family protein [Sphingobium phenoxybenzoativorans]|uniref:Nuclear transport factor 2 family protein n=1 Tax=Sphingobium phenoxybenzoativorans TaxID=1592790 RepID=A0A975K4C7_9SPHN|nr:nuclear transport factor 2 family protein [Sphingobium phenoxybenzoativorans]QUT04598.1 nuclear transport factor 2 family protein [Sphingobium phenoxybenzoativorans]